MLDPTENKYSRFVRQSGFSSSDFDDKGKLVPLLTCIVAIVGLAVVVCVLLFQR